MKSREQIEAVLRNLDLGRTKYPAMTYEHGIDEALSWVLGDINDDEFGPLVED